MTWEHRGELRADPGSAPGERNIAAAAVRKNSVWPSIAVVAAAAAFGGVIWFAYKQGREATGGGTPPLVHAEAGPVKVKPDQPGGQEIPFQDSTVYDRLNQNGQKPPATENILPPPEAPLARPKPAPAVVGQSGQASAGGTGVVSDLPPLPPADTSPTALAPPPGAVVALPPPPKPAAKSAPVPNAAIQQPPAKPTAVVQQPAAAATKPSQATTTKPPVAMAPTVKPKDVAAAQPKPAAKAAPQKGAQVESIAALESRALADFSAPKAEATTKAAPAMPVHKGGVRLQLSSVRTQDGVEAEWSRLKHRYPELAGLGLSSAKAEVPGKGTFYRLQAGPLDEARAKATCDHLRAQGLGCIVVKP